MGSGSYGKWRQVMRSGVSFGNPPQVMTLDAYLARPRYTPYRYNPAAIGLGVNERFTHMIHMLAVTAAMCYPNRCSLIPSVEEVAAREREAAAWNHSATGYHGD